MTEFLDGREKSREDASHLANEGRRAENPRNQTVIANVGLEADQQRKENKKLKDLEDSRADIRSRYKNA